MLSPTIAASGGERDHELDFELAPGGEHGGGDQRRLARDRHPGRLGHHEHEQQRVAGDFDEVGDVDDGREHLEGASGGGWGDP